MSTQNWIIFCTKTSINPKRVEPMQIWNKPFQQLVQTRVKSLNILYFPHATNFVIRFLMMTFYSENKNILWAVHWHTWNHIKLTKVTSQLICNNVNIHIFRHDSCSFCSGFDRISLGSWGTASIRMSFFAF